MATGRTKDACKPTRTKGVPGAGLTGARAGKVAFDKPALEPYWGKLAVRNLRGDGGNVGIIRSPVRASILPDYGLMRNPPAHGHRAALLL